MNTDGNVKTFNPQTPLYAHAMTMNQFESYLLESLKDYLHLNDDEVHIETVRNEEDSPETGLFLTYDGGLLGLPVEALYRVFQKAGMHKLLIDIENAFNKGKRIFDEKRNSTFETFAENLIIRPLNVNIHHKDLKECIYSCVGDVALTLYHARSDNDYLITHRVTKEELGTYGKSEEEVLKRALANTVKRYPAITVNFHTSKEILVMEESFTKEEISSFTGSYILSTTKGSNGAVALFYPGVVEKMWNVLRDDFIAVFMNTTDVMLLDQDSPFIASAQAIAGQQDEFGEILSSRKYLCKKDGSINVM
ncbi:MAG: DUF5688 family protein [Erysipelotrichaceae bacterium]|jgi:hypothetical protein|nr:DUF5688 family protein [Erysipelotrichaceae bacterium]